MSDASTLGNMSPGLLRVVERAQREPEGRLHSLAHLIDVPALGRAFHLWSAKIRSVPEQGSMAVGEGRVRGWSVA